MDLVWPPALLLLLLVPLGILGYRRLDRRRGRGIEAFGRPREVAAPERPAARLRRAIPGALVVLGLAVLSIGLARPEGTLALPQRQGTVILAFDVSGSMAATDLKPTRMDAAKAAAKDFVERQPTSIAIGVVAFSDAGLSVQQPTSDQGAVLAAIQRLAPQKGTAVGQGILASLGAIQAALAGPGTDYYSNRSPSPAPSPTPVPAGTHAPAVIVLLSDGENNEAPDPAQAAQAAADRGVRIYTVGVGSEGGATLDLDGFRVHTQLDAATLQQVAQATGGTYYAAADAGGLKAIYDGLDTQLLVRPQQVELTAAFAGLGLVLLSIGALASLAWMGRLP